MKLSEKNTLEKIKVEIALMEMVKHENIVRYYETYKYMECLFMVIEYCDGGYFFSLTFQLSYRNYLPELPGRSRANNRIHMQTTATWARLFT